MDIALLAYPGFQLLDVSGPAAVFGAAADAIERHSRVVVVSHCGGPITSNCGVAVMTERLPRLENLDGLFVVGGSSDGIDALIADDATSQWFKAQAAQARRFGSICSGAFAIAAWGLACGKRVTTHWNDAQKFRRRFPDVQLCNDHMFVEDGDLWTSAGVSAGIDMALAIVQRDLGLSVANAVAHRLVLYVRRAGNQSQYSAFLDLENRATGRYHKLASFVAANMSQRIDVSALAQLAGETPRSFFRNFKGATGQTPAQFISSVRLDQARAMLSNGAAIKVVSATCGYGSAEHFSRAFATRFGISPSFWKENNLQ